MKRRDYGIVKKCETLQSTKSADLWMSNTKMEKVMRACHHHYHFGAGFSLPTEK